VGGGRRGAGGGSTHRVNADAGWGDVQLCSGSAYYVSRSSRGAAGRTPVHALCALEESKLIGIIIGPRRMPISHACSMEWIGSYREVLRVDRPLLWRIMIVEMQ
jgi:hypothetical protein